MNLLLNGCQAIQGNGQIRLATRREGDEVVVEIADTGCGIPDEKIDKLFEPGFTTKGARVGMGLGLAIAYSIITEHRGSIHVASTLGEGSTFTIRLPIAMRAGAAS